jgi:hypothetical protein
MNSLAQRKQFRNSITEFHRQFEEYDDVITGDENIEKHNPMEHFFADGQYIRKITFPAQEFIVTKIHKKSSLASDLLEVCPTWPDRTVYL